MLNLKTFVEEKKKKQPKFHKHFIGKKHPDDKKKKKKTFKESLSFSRIQKIYQTFGTPKTLSRNSQLDKRHNQLMSQYNTNGMSDRERKAINHYTGDGAESVKSYLYNDFKGEPGFESEHAHYEDTQSALDRVPLKRSMHVYSGMRSLEGLPHENGHIHVENAAFTSTSIDPTVGAKFGSLKRRDGAPSEHRYWVDHPNVKNHLTDVTPPVPEGTKADPNNEEHRKLGAHLKKIPFHKEQSQGGYFQGYKHLAKIHVPSGSRGMYVEHVTNNKEEYEHILPAGSKFAFKTDPTVDHKSKTVTWSGKLVHDGHDWTSHGRAMELDKQKPKQGDLFDGNK